MEGGGGLFEGGMLGVDIWDGMRCYRVFFRYWGVFSVFYLCRFIIWLLGYSWVGVRIHMSPG